MSALGNKPPGHEKVAAFIVARLSSSRLSQKQLMPIGPRLLIEWIIRELRSCREVDEIIIATAAEEANRPLKALSCKESIPCFWFEGEVDHVTTRLRKAAERFDADICILVSGDCPLIYAPAIDQLVVALRNAPWADWIKIKSDEKNRPPALHGISLARKRAWQQGDDLSDRSELKEHQFPILGMRRDLFKPLACRLGPELYSAPQRFSVDTFADLEFMQRVYAMLDRKGLPFALPDAIKLLKAHPYLREINSHVHQRQLVEDVKNIVFCIDAGGQKFGYGHLMRSIELASQIVERLGWPVTFIVDDLHAEALIRERGMPAFWGAFARSVQKPPASRKEIDFEKFVSDFDVLIIDIFDQRKVAADWRDQWGLKLPVVAIDNLLPWALQVDLMVTPGVALKAVERFSKANSKTSLEMVDGLEYVILRREIRRALNSVPPKDIDLFVYLHDGQRRRMVADVARESGINAVILEDYDADFAELLARSTVFLSAFGYSFYEALYLKSFPVCWPDSAPHRKDAIEFYKKLGLPRTVISSEADLKRILAMILAQKMKWGKKISDGSANIIKRIVKLTTH